MTDSQTHIENAQRLELVYDRNQISTVIDEIVSKAEALNYGSSSLFAVRLAIEEAITNAFEHGHDGLDASLTIKVEYAVSDKQIQIAVEDQGPGFAPEELPDPTHIMTRISTRDLVLDLERNIASTDASVFIEGLKYQTNATGLHIRFKEELFELRKNVTTEIYWW